jgi:hypothetical protein
MNKWLEPIKPRRGAAPTLWGFVFNRVYVPTFGLADIGVRHSAR